MYTIVYKPNIAKIILISIIICVYIVGVYYFLNYYLSHSTIIFLFVITISLLLLMRAIGIFLTYPGTFRYMNAQIQKNQNDNLLYNIHNCLNKIEEMSNKIVTKKLNQVRRIFYQFYSSNLISSMSTQINAIKKCEEPSKKKQKLIQYFQMLIQHIVNPLPLMSNQSDSSELSSRQFMFRAQENQKQLNLQISLGMIFDDPKNILSFTSEAAFSKLQRRCQRIIKECRLIWSLCCEIATIPTHQSSAINQKLDGLQSQQQMTNNQDKKDPNDKPIKVDKYQAARWHLFQQKLFTTDSYFAYWDNVFEYTRVTVPIGKGQIIQCAIIHSQKIKQPNNKQQIKQKYQKNPGVLFSNPNGAIFQQLALNSSYINFYLKWGLQIVLWNYRGYAKSTGYSTISHCVSDVYKVYKHVQKIYRIKIQVLHGYSIGGICAINLAKKLTAKSNNRIKLLIADRTLSSIDKVAKGFIKKDNMVANFIKLLATPIVKLLFFSECFDNSKIFMQCKCAKVIIYDIYDQIICKQASLKQGVQNNSFKLRGKLIEEQQIFNPIELKNKANSFSTQICNIYRQDKAVCEKIIQILKSIDGGGQSISLSLIIKKNAKEPQITIQKIDKICKEFFVGLFIYGPKLCVPFYPKQESRTQWINKKIDNIISDIEDLKLKVEHLVACQNRIANILNTLAYVRQNLTPQKHAQKQKIFGQVIVTQVGHNRQLKKQYMYLDNIFAKTYKRQTLMRTQEKEDKQQKN